jgi:hypothetical protein
MVHIYQMVHIKPRRSHNLHVAFFPTRHQEIGVKCRSLADDSFFFFFFFEGPVGKKAPDALQP